MIKKFLYVLFVFDAIGAIGQDVQYSQYYANPLYLNPAFTGAINNHRVAINHRLQWPDLPKAFTNYSVSYDYNAAELNSGFGLLINVDRAGSANLSNTSAAFNYSYTISFRDEWIIKPAVSLGFVSRTIDFNKLVFGDQIDFGVDGAPSQDPSIGSIENNNYMDVGSGLLIYNKRFWAGFSGFHLNEPNNSLIGGASKVPAKYTIHGGARFQLGNPDFKDIKKASVAPSFIYKRQGDYEQLDVGASFHYSPVMLGLFYRGMPWIETVPNRGNHEAVILVFGVDFQNLQFGYSFDSNISKLSAESGGAHEISLIYLFDIQRNRAKPSRSKRFLPCPAFIDKLGK